MPSGDSSDILRRPDLIDDGRDSVASNGSSTRLPFHVVQRTSTTIEDDVNAQNERALASRYSYYNRLDPYGDCSLRMPDHVVPPNFFSVIPFQKPEAKQSSIVTIFSIWNTMVGTSLLSLPWALGQAGFCLGLILILGMAGVCFYTALRVVQSPTKIEQFVKNNPAAVEFTDVCRFHYGKIGERTALLFSIVTLLGAAIIYWVLMSNFLYFTGTAIYDAMNADSSMALLKNNSLHCDVICISRDQSLSVDSVHSAPLFGANSSSGRSASFDRYWHLQHTVPLFLVALIFPLLNFKSPTFFTKFNGLGTLAIIYLMVFVSIKAQECGFNIQFWDPNLASYAPLFGARFFSLSGILSLSFFIHNCVLSILRNQSNPANNVRDLSIAYCLVTVTYLFIAVLFYAAFPLLKSCIADNFLNNFGGLDLFSSIARFFLLFQMATVYPLLMFIIRVQLFSWLVESAYPSLFRVLLLNAAVVCTCVLFAVFVPKVGRIISFTGSFCGLAFVFTLPCMVFMAEEYLAGRLTKLKCIIHVGLIILGSLNFFGQFFLL